MRNYHDFMVEPIQIGPRRELVLFLRDLDNRSWGIIRFSSIQNYTRVQDWHQGNEDVIDPVNESDRLATIDDISEASLGSAEFSYEICLNSLEPLSLRSRQIQEKLHNN